MFLLFIRNIKSAQYIKAMLKESRLIGLFLSRLGYFCLASLLQHYGGVAYTFVVRQA